MARVLIVDDELEILSLLTDQLRSKGHEVIATTSPISALEFLRIPSNHFELVICDVIMPTKNGLDFIKEVQRLPWFDGEIALMSSYISSLDKEIQTMGIKHILKKPFTLDHIVNFMAAFVPVID